MNRVAVTAEFAGAEIRLPAFERLGTILDMQGQLARPFQGCNSD
jgi:hypothetical protein